MHKDMNDLDDNEYSAWLAQVGEVRNLSAPSEEALVELFSDAVREQDPREKAKQLVHVANMCWALADKTLGAQGLVATCMVLNKH